MHWRHRKEKSCAVNVEFILHFKFTLHLLWIVPSNLACSSNFHFFLRPQLIYEITVFNKIITTTFDRSISLMKNSYLVLIGCIAFCLIACKSTKNSSNIVHRELPEITIKPEPFPNEKYHASNSILHELMDTKLEVSFDWQKQYLYGKATLTLRPHFYDQTVLWLDARGMEINSVQLILGDDSIPLFYNYANDSLKITLNKTYKALEQYRIYINYISKPEELKDVNGSDAINSNKGLFFINPLGEEKDKPMQIWTQGETQSNSVWFPTINSPNQKMTQEISITIDTAFTTLSNGLLIKSKFNRDGTRTDIWKQILPHAPYLAMMAIGKFAIVKDHWRNKEVNYYVEPQYKNVARKIFGKTPEMMDFFSNKLKVDYPWDKYSEVVVRDYVSGAMENTSATIFGEFMQRDDRELIDENYEEYVAHELFHHWFGDLVTCESWSNTPLNESFATLGEYLWNEHEYGRDYADIYLQKDMNDYLRESRGKQVDLIRYYYNSDEEMFDRHSYEKGGCILNMLRRYVGDDAFFTSLHNYLETNKFKTVEAHQLRLAFEEVTGEDLNWFFNEWFFNKGHLQLDISYNWSQEKKEASVTVLQQQDLQTTPLYHIPVDVDIYENGKKRRERIIITAAKEIFTFKCDLKPELINFDAEKMILGVKTDHHTEEEWMELFNNGLLYLDRFEALQHIGKLYTIGTPQAMIVKKALRDKNWKIRNIALHNIVAFTHSSEAIEIKDQLITISKNDVKSSNRSYALGILADNYSGNDMIELLKIKLNDSSYDVAETAVQLLMEKDSISGLLYIKNLEKDTSFPIMDIVTGIYAKYGNDAQLKYMNLAFSKNKTSGRRYTRIQNFAKFLMRCNEQQGIEEGLFLLREEGKNASPWYNRLAAAQALSDLISKFYDRERTTDPVNDPKTVSKFTSLQIIAEKYLDELKNSESDNKLKKIYNNK